MPIKRASVSNVLSNVRAEIEREVEQAAGNQLLSKAEQKKLGAGLLAQVADEIRARAPGTRVTSDLLVEQATSRIGALLGQVNQPSGAGASTVSQDEVKALARTNHEAGLRVARAYEVITGKRIALDVAPPAPPATGGTPLAASEQVLASLGAHLEYLLAQAAGRDRWTFTPAERDAMAPGLLRDAVSRTLERVPAGPMVFEATGDALRLLEPLLSAAGLNMDYAHGNFPAGTPLEERMLTREVLERLVALNSEAAGLVADAVDLAAGARPDVAGLPPSRRPPAEGRREVNDGPAAPDGALRIDEAWANGLTRLYFESGDLVVTRDAAADPPGRRSIGLVVSGRRLDIELAEGETTVRAAVERLRSELPDLDVVTVSPDIKALKLRLYPRGTAPRPAGFPNYAHFLNPAPSQWEYIGDMSGFVRRLHGTKSFELSPGDDVPPGGLRLVVDHKIYEVAEGGPIQTGYDAIRELKRQLEADGVQLDYNEWGGPGGGYPVKFKIL